MTKAELQQLFWLRKEIEQYSIRIRELESALTGGVSKLEGMPKAPGISDRTGQFVPEIVRLRDLAEEKLAQAISEVERLETYIATIDDAQTRTVFRLRYVNGLSWQQVALRLGGNTADSARMMHNRHLAALIDENVS